MRSLRFLFLYIVLALLVSSCGPKPDPNEPPFPDDPVPVEPDDPDAKYNCSTACKHLRGDDGSGLDCEEGKETPEGGTCEKVCENTLGTPTEMPVECMSKVEDCSQTDSCSR